MRTTAILFGSLLFSLTASLAEAGWVTAVMRDISRGYHRNRCWPLPFNLMDQKAVQAPFGMMVQNGWQMQTRIGPDHYQPGTAELNEAGRRHVHWVVTQVPPSQRILYVSRAPTEPETVARLEAVRRETDRYASDGSPVQVVPSDLAADSFSPRVEPTPAAEGNHGVYRFVPIGRGIDNGSPP
jgi:hypothetical protein